MARSNCRWSSCLRALIGLLCLSTSIYRARGGKLKALCHCGTGDCLLSTPLRSSLDLMLHEPLHEQHHHDQKSHQRADQHCSPVAATDARHGRACVIRFESFNGMPHRWIAAASVNAAARRSPFLGRLRYRARNRRQLARYALAIGLSWHLSLRVRCSTGPTSPTAFAARRSPIPWPWHHHI